MNLSFPNGRLWAFLSNFSFTFLSNPKNKEKEAAAIRDAPAPKEYRELAAAPSLPPRKLPLLAATNLISLDLQPLLSQFRSRTSTGSLPVPARRLRTTPSDAGCPLPLFRPYVAKVPWHGGVRAFLSQLFPRYGHYCGPNWSSGKDGGSLLWDRRPIDWLDLCCYCHDIGYDSYDQARLLKADMAFLECLQRPRMPTKGDARVAELYKSMCIAGLRSILIPYRMQLVRMQGRQPNADTVASTGCAMSSGRSATY